MPEAGDRDPSTRKWAQVPSARARRQPGLPLIAWALAALPMTVQLHRLGHDSAAITRSIGISLIGVLLAARWPRWSLLVLVGGTGLLVIDRSVPAITLALLAALAALWSEVTGAVETEHFRPTATARALAAAPALAADVALVIGTGVRVPLILTTAGAVTLAAGSLIPERPGRAFGARALAANLRLVERIGRPIGAAIGAVAMVPVSLVATIGWVGHRFAGLDVLGPPVAQGTRWVIRGAADVRTTHADSNTQVWDPRGAAQGTRRLLATTVSLTLVAGLAWAVVATTSLNWPWGAEPAGAQLNSSAWIRQCLSTPEEPNPVLDDQPGSARLLCESENLVRRPRFNAATVYDFPDFAGTWVHEANGIRRTWRPPACACRRLTVWWFGGSGAWGWDQRDEFSLPSQLARAAHAEGLALDVINYAVPAWVLGQERALFERLLETEHAPDLAVFYDGGNELNRQKERNGRGRGADESPTSFMEAELDDYLWNGPLLSGQAVSDRTNSYHPAPQLPSADVAHHAMNRYRADLDRARRTGATAGVDPVFVWQPLMASAPPQAARPNAVPAVDERVWSKMVPAAVAELPPGVINLADSLDQVDRPVFDDFYHHNEYAASIVAKALLDGLRPRIAAALKTPGAPRTGG